MNGSSELSILAKDLALLLEPRTQPDATKSSPLALGRFLYGKAWKDSKHLDLMNDALIEAATVPNSRLIISMPPRHGKSEMTSKFFPAWYLGTYPDKRVILTSYEATFAQEWGGQVRDILDEHGPELFGITLKEDSKAKDKWRVANHRGGMQTAGAGGAITGKGADLLLIDDPIKNAEQAYSAIHRNNLWAWWQTTARSRLEPGASIVIIMTRWHNDDLVGRLLEQDKDRENWKVISLPLLAEEEDPLGREEGDLLWPGRFTMDEIQSLKADTDSYTWNALYQQRPIAQGGGMFKFDYFRNYRVEEHFENEALKRSYLLQRSEEVCDTYRYDELWLFSMMDLAISTAKDADYTVISTFGVTPKRDLLILDVVRGRFEAPDQPRKVKEVFDRWHPSYIGIESVAYQLALIQALQREGIPVRQMRPKGGKEARAMTAAVKYEASQIWHPEYAPWKETMESELTSFPGGKHDDIVDTVAYAAIQIQLGMGQSFRVLDPFL
jgi:predicted phage terminase large subunit-like protein